jgi:hypothetical protein
VAELVEAISGGDAPPASASPSTDDALTTVTSGEPKTDLFASGADEAFSGSAAQPAATAKPAGGDLFASPATASPFGASAAEAEDHDDQDVVASQPSPRVSSQQASMTGQRNENSVLFSLSNLQALATGSEAAPSPAATKASAPAAAPASSSLGHAMGEGSGLIDIRALASAASGPKPAMSSSGGGSAVDDLLSIGTGPALGGALGSPMLSPAPEKESSGPNLKALYAVVGVLGIGLVAAVAYLFTREPQQIVVTQEGPGAAAAAPTAGAAPGATTVVAGGEAQPTEVAAAEAAPSDDDDDEDSDSTAARSTRESSRTRTASTRDRDRTSTTSTMQAASAPSTSTMSDPAPSTMRASGDLDALMGEVIGMSATESTSTTASNLPEQPSRSAVRSALGGRAGAVSACDNGSGGTAMAAVTFAGSGSVSSVRVTGVTGTVAACVSSAVRRARVPPFSRASFNVTFPYRL